MTLPEGQKGQAGIIPEITPARDLFGLRHHFHGLYRVFTQGGCTAFDDYLRPEYRHLEAIAQKAKKGGRNS